MEGWLAALEQFHFLRPLWLLVLPAGLLMAWLLRRRSEKSDWQAFIAPALLQALITRPENQSRVTPELLVGLLIVCWVLALAGPTWKRQPSPFVDDTAPLVVAIYLGDSMLLDDLRPNRLTLAKQKVSQLLQRRKGAPTALIAYAGSAHTVLPLTEDSGILELYLQDLQPDVMPNQGNRLDLAMAQARQLLGPLGGGVVIVGDDLQGAISVQQPHHKSADISVSFLSILPQYNRDTSLQQQLHDQGMTLIPLSLDEGDIDIIVKNLERRWQLQLQQRDDVQWQDAGYYFIWPVMLMMAFFFRRGMVLRW